MSGLMAAWIFAALNCWKRLSWRGSVVRLKVANVESYYGPIMAIRGVSLEVPRGKIVTVLGANGAGKTTILKTISGVLDPLKGTVTPTSTMRVVGHDGREIHKVINIMGRVRTCSPGARVGGVPAC